MGYVSSLEGYTHYYFVSNNHGSMVKKLPSLETGNPHLPGSPVYLPVGGGRVMCHRCGAGNANARDVAMPPAEGAVKRWSTIAGWWFPRFEYVLLPVEVGRLSP